eukprot:s3652_g2.t1
MFSKRSGFKSSATWRSVLVQEISKVPKWLVPGDLKNFKTIVFIVADFQDNVVALVIFIVELDGGALGRQLEPNFERGEKLADLDQWWGRSRAWFGGGDGGLVERLLLSESEVGDGPAAGADSTEDRTGSETGVGGLGGGGISVVGQEEAGVEAMRRRLTRRSVAGGGEEGRDELAM